MLRHWFLSTRSGLSFTCLLPSLCLLPLVHYGGVKSHRWLMTPAAALLEHFHACLPSSVGDPPPVAEQLYYPPPNPSSAVTSAEHLTEISLSCGGSYPLLTCASLFVPAFGLCLFPACAASGGPGPALPGSGVVVKLEFWEEHRTGVVPCSVCSGANFSITAFLPAHCPL